MRKGSRVWNKWHERSLVHANLAEAKKAVAVRVTDMLGEEVWVVKQV